MVDGVLLLVDASEGPLPQTRFVLRKALEARLPVILVVNKVDRPDARIAEVVDEVYELFLDLDADESQIEFPIVYTNARAGWASLTEGEEGTDLEPLMRPARRAHPRALLRRRPPAAGPRHEPRRVALRRPPRALPRAPRHDPPRPGRRLVPRRRDASSARRSRSSTSPRRSTASSAEEAGPGEIIAVAGIPEVTIGETLADPDDPRPLPVITVDEPSLSVIDRHQHLAARRPGRRQAHRAPGPRAAGAGARRQRVAARRRTPSARTPGRSRAAASCSSPCSSSSCAARASS